MHVNRLFCVVSIAFGEVIIAFGGVNNYSQSERDSIPFSFSPSLLPAPPRHIPFLPSHVPAPLLPSTVFPIHPPCPYAFSLPPFPSPIPFLPYPTPPLAPLPCPFPPSLDFQNLQLDFQNLQFGRFGRRESQKILSKPTILSTSAVLKLVVCGILATFASQKKHKTALKTKHSITCHTSNH